jgi:hypothetical protein
MSCNPNPPSKGRDMKVGNSHSTNMSVSLLAITGRKRYKIAIVQGSKIAGSPSILNSEPVSAYTIRYRGFTKYEDF